MTGRGRPADSESFLRLDAAFRAGDLDALRAAMGPVEGFPNVVAHPAIGLCLIYAIYHSPIALVRALLDAGADVRRDAGDGFPPLIAAVGTFKPAPGARARADAGDLLELLLSRGADVGERGINDFTPLHLAAGLGALPAVDLLLAHGADPNAVTRIDDRETPLDVARQAGHLAVVARLEPLTTARA
jgi:ankyrin repeat protein